MPSRPRTAGEDAAPASPRMPVSTAKRPPASGSLSGPPGVSRRRRSLVMNSVESVGPPNAGIVGFNVGTAIRRSTTPSGVTRSTADP